MPFGFTNALTTFQSLMNEIFRPYLRKFVLVFFDDILVYSKNSREHFSHWQQVLEVLKREQLFANRKKCAFGQPQIEYLGHVISGRGVFVDPAKVQPMTNWLTPKNV